MRHVHVLALVILASLTPFAAASHTAPCDETRSPTVAWYYVFAGTTRITIWAETNGVPGLQTSACTSSTGAHAVADTRTYDSGPFSVRCPIPGFPNICLF